MTENKTNVLIIGSFSGNNFGDTLVLLSVVKILDQVYGEKITYIIPTTNPGFIKGLFNNERFKAIDLKFRTSRGVRFLNFELFKLIPNVSLIITTAGILFDYKLFDPRFNFLTTLWPLLYFAKKQGTKIYGMNVGISPSSTLIGKCLLSKVLNLHDLIATRDKNSFDLINLISKTNSAAFADLSHVYFPTPCEVDKEKLIIGINLTPYQVTSKGITDTHQNGFEKNLIENLKTLIRKNIEFHFYSTTKLDDAYHHQLKTLLNDTKIQVFDLYTHNAQDVFTFFNNISLFIGTRLHACIISTNLEIPTIGISYHPKVRDYFTEIGVVNCLIERKEVANDGLIDKIDWVVNNYKNIKEILHHQIQNRKFKANNSIDYFKEFSNTIKRPN